jgi:hypothetical protein
MKIEWIPAPENAEKTRQILEEQGAKMQIRMGFDPLNAILIVAGITVIADSIVRLYRDVTYAGVLIDATSETVKVKEMPGWPREQVLVITPQGTHFFQGSKISLPGEIAELNKMLGGAA